MPDSIKIGIGLFKNESVKAAVNSIKSEFNTLKQDIESSWNDIRDGGMMVAGAGLAAFSLLEVISDQDDALQELKDSTRSTDQEFKTLKDDVYELNAALGLRSVTKSAELLKTVSRQSKTTGEDLNTLAFQTGLLAQKFDDEEGVLSAQVSLMKTYGVSVRESGDSVAYLLDQGGDRKGELLESLNEYAVQFKEAGFNLQQTVSMISAGLDNSWNIDKSADAIKEARLRLFAGDKSTVDAFDILGLSGLSERIQNDEIGITEAFGLISSKMQGLSKSDMLKAGSGIFGTQWEDAGSESVLAMLDSMSNEVKTTGTLDNMAALMKSRFSFKWKSALSETANSISETLDSLKPLILPLVEWFGEASTSVREFSQEYGYITKTIATGVAGFISLTAAMGSIKLIMGAASLAVTAFTSPLILVAGAVAGVAYGLYKLEEKTGLVSKTIGGVMDYLEPSITGLKETVFDLIGEWSSLWDSLTEGTSIFEGVSIDIETISSVIGAGIDLLIINPLKMVLGLIGKIPKLVTSFKDMWDSGFSFDSIKNFGSVFVDFIYTPIETTLETISSIIDKFGFFKDFSLSDLNPFSSDENEPPRKKSSASAMTKAADEYIYRWQQPQAQGQTAPYSMQTTYQIGSLNTRERSFKRTLRNAALTN